MSEEITLKLNSKIYKNLINLLWYMVYEYDVGEEEKFDIIKIYKAVDNGVVKIEKTSNVVYTERES